MEIRFPVRVGLMDDDCFALKWNAGLLMRDLRTTVCFESESPSALLQDLEGCSAIDIILLDTEYYPHEPGISDLIMQLRQINPQAIILCLSQYAESKTFQAVLENGATGYLLKQEIRMGIGSALVKALEVDFLVTPGVLPLAQRHPGEDPDRIVTIIAWKPNPHLSPQLRKVFTLKVLYGMSAPLTAQEIHLAPGTVEKYMQYAYQKLTIPWGDERYLEGLDLESTSPEMLAFHLFSLPPKNQTINEKL